MQLKEKTHKGLYIKNYGCQMNVYDGDRMHELLSPLNYKRVDDPNDAELIILNTCHIREKASEKVYSELGRIKKIKDDRLRRLGKDIIIVVAGCVGQAEGEQIFYRTPYVDIVVGPQSYYSLPNLIARIVRSEKHLIELDFVEEKKFDYLPTDTTSQGASAFISVQEGCDKFCTFCVVPYTRGAEFSRKVEDIYREVTIAVSKGSQEVYLLGQNVNAYHGKTSDNRTFSLADLIDRIAQINGVKRIRYTTSHPRDMSDDLIKIHATENKLMPFLHLPIQSGSNKILKAMNRKHTREEYLTIIDKLRTIKPDIALSSDFIVGFPGETEEDFEDTLDIVRRVNYAQCFSFKYSPRPGTPAAIKQQIPENIRAERLEHLQKLLSKQQMYFNINCIGKTLPVLFSKNGKLSNQIIGKSPYLQSVYVDKLDESYIGKIINVKITSSGFNSLQGLVNCS